MKLANMVSVLNHHRPGAVKVTLDRTFLHIMNAHTELVRRKSTYVLTVLSADSRVLRVYMVANSATGLANPLFPSS